MSGSSNRSRAHVDAMKANGLALVTPQGERRVAVNAATTAPKSARSIW